MAKPIPREILFGNPEKASPKISPNGKHTAFLAPDQGVLNVWLGPSDKGPEAAKPLTKDRGRGIRSYLWAEDERSLLYIQDKDGDENWHIHQTDIFTGSTRDLTPHPGTQAQLIGTDPGFPDELLVGLNLRDKKVHDVYRINLKTGESRLEVKNPGDVTGWLADNRFVVRVAKAMLPDGGSELRIRDGSGGPFTRLMGWGPDDQGGALGFTPDGKGLYVESSDDSDTTCLWRVSIDGKEKKLLARKDSADLGEVMLHPRHRHVEAAAFELERRHWTVLDPSLEDDFKALAEAAEGDFHIVSRDDADTIWFVLYNSDRRPPAYYRYHRKTRKADFLFSTRPKLDGYALAEMKPIAITARDGLRLQSYLTLPDGAGKNLPLVLHVHGGPWVRDSWGYHPEIQWLANQGYAVLQVNYRGSQGFGKKFLHAGDREWGAKMQDDLTDSVAWAVKEGIADPKRVAIYGGSYGGYAALAGAAFTPEVYCCAVDIVGPSNLETLIRSIPPYWAPMRRIFDLRVGNVDTELDFLKSRSPLFHSQNIEIPLLIAQGANDPRVKQAESEMIVSALRKKGKAVEYLLFKDEGHGFARPENRLEFYAAAEKFLARHLGRPKPAPAAAR